MKREGERNTHIGLSSGRCRALDLYYSLPCPAAVVEERASGHGAAVHGLRTCWRVVGRWPVGCRAGDGQVGAAAAAGAVVEGSPRAAPGFAGDGSGLLLWSLVRRWRGGAAGAVR